MTSSYLKCAESVKCPWKVFEFVCKTLERGSPRCIVGGLILCIAAVLALSWGLWRLRISRYNEFLGVKKSVHIWTSFETSAYPQYCTGCKQLIFGFWIFQNTGWECAVCGRTAHLSCLGSCDKFPCKCPSQSYPVKHQLVQGNLPSNSFCCICGIICSSPFGLYGLRCLWCARTIDEDCLPHLPESCDLGLLRHLILPPSLVVLSVAPSSHSFFPSYAFSSSLTYHLNDNQLDRLNDFSSSAQRYLKAMGLHLKEGINQVQMAMVAGLIEGLKEVTKDVRAINDLFVTEFKERMRRMQSKGPKSESCSVKLAESRDTTRTALTSWKPLAHTFRKSCFLKHHRSSQISCHCVRKVKAQSSGSEVTVSLDARSAEEMQGTGNKFCLEENQVICWSCLPASSKLAYRDCVGKVRITKRKKNYCLNSRIRRRKQRRNSGALSLAGSVKKLIFVSECADNGVRWRVGGLKRGISPAILEPARNACREREGRSGSCKKISPHPVASTSNDQRNPVSERHLEHLVERDFGNGDSSIAESNAQPVACELSDIATPKSDSATRDTSKCHSPYYDSVASASHKSKAVKGRRVSQHERIATQVAALKNSSADRYNDRVFELAKLVPAKADVWKICLHSEARIPGKDERRDSKQVFFKMRRNKTIRRLLKNSEINGTSFQMEVNPAVSINEIKDKKPLLVLVNVKSGGKQGVTLLKEFYKLLNPIQVVDVSSNEVLTNALCMFEQLASMSKLRVLVCGGDGTAGWVINGIQNVYGPSRKHQVPVGILPLGTGNDLSRVLGWGEMFDGALEKFLYRIETAQTRLLDLWKIEARTDGKDILQTKFTNYMDIGVAAKIALQFHRLRERYPELFQSRLGNKFLYGKVGVREWVSEKPIDLSDVQVWCDGDRVFFPETKIQGFIVSNIPSFSGGVDLWKSHELLADNYFESSDSPVGHHKSAYLYSSDGSDTNAHSDSELTIERFKGNSQVTRNWKPQSINDGLIEVVAVRSLFHLGQIQVGLTEPVRLCQGHEIKIEIPLEVPFQIDGEPRLIPPCTLRISHEGEALVLSPLQSHDNAVISKAFEVLDIAVKGGTLSNVQRIFLLKEFMKQG